MSHATDCEIVAGTVTAAGRWGNAPYTAGTYSWSMHQVLSIRWARSSALAREEVVA
jgi:hypothetical protein